MDYHAKVRRVSDAVKGRPAGATVVTRRGKPTHQVRGSKWKEGCHAVDISDLTNILSVAEGTNRRGGATMVAKCEALVTIEALVRHVLPLGYTPEVVPEFPNFTVSGLVNGEGIQSSGFRYGLFTKSVVEMEVVLGNGDVCVTSANEEPQLFEGLVESYGTLAIVVSVSVALRRSFPFVRTRYVVSTSLDAFTEYFDAAVRRQSVDFLEGVVYSPDRYVTIESTFAPTADGVPFFDPRPFDVECGEEYFYQHIANHVLGGAKRDADVMPTDSFLFRSFRGLYWIIECFVNNKALIAWPWMRRFCDRRMKSKYDRNGLQPSDRLTTDELTRCLVHQDMGVWLCRLREGIAWVQQRLGVYPLWICPVATFASGNRDDYVCDIGIYGEPTVQPFYHSRVLKELQNFVDFPSLWGVGYLDPDVMRQKWAPLRQKYHAEGVFVALDTKVIHKVSDKDDEGPIPQWRLVNTFGWYWRYKFAAVFVAIAAAVWVAVSAVVASFR